MIRFACPRCKSVWQQPDSVAGTRFACPNCGQALQAPAPPEGKPLPDTPPDLPASVPSAIVPQPPPTMATPLFVAESQQAPEPAPRWPARPPPLPSSAPAQSRRRDRDDDDEFDDEFSSIARHAPRRGRFSPEVAARAASSGLVCSLVSLGLLLVSFLLSVLSLSNQRRRFGGENEPLFVIVLLVTLGSFVLALLAIVFSSRGLDQSNTYNRGQATAGLVCGIIALVIGSLVMLFSFCMGMFVWRIRGW